jgi:DNA-binding response OmpR family regulator
MRVTGFKSGQALMDFLKDNRPDLILLGSVLWEIGGFDAISALKNVCKAGKGIPVLLMAEQGEPDPEARAQAMGAAGVVRKPFVAAELTACVLGILYSITQPLITRIEGIEATGLGATGMSIDIGRVVVIDQRHIEHAGFHIASGCAGISIIVGCKHRHGGHERQASGNSQSFHWAISILELFDIHVSCNTLLTDQAS